MKKILLIRIIITVIVWTALVIYQDYFMLFDTNENAIAQVENSDAAYAKWQAWKNFIDLYWVLYLLPLVMFIPLLFKKKNN